MAKKDDLKALIIELEPANTAAADSRSSHGQLTTELVKVRERLAAVSAVPAIPGTVRFRVEDQGFSWRVEAEDFLSELYYGPALPAFGTRIPNDEGEPIEISEHQAGLVLRAGDLEKREAFDSRRIYVTESGNEVVFKRVDPTTNKPVLWSFRQSMEIMVGVNTKLTRTNKSAKQTASSGRRMTQKSLSAYLIAANPSITGVELTTLLREAFPLARVEGRHGPHYLSLSRTGKLPEASEDDPRTWANNG